MGNKLNARWRRALQRSTDPRPAFHGIDALAVPRDPEVLVVRRRERRVFLRTLGALSLAVGGCKADTRMRRIAFINVGPEAPNAPNVAAFRDGLRELGYVEGQNAVIDFRWGDQQPGRLPALIAELLALRPDVFVSTGGPPTIRALKSAATPVPTVFITGDPVAEGIVADLAHPGGNLTGFSLLQTRIEGKRLEVLRDAIPGVRRLAVVWNPAGPAMSLARDHTCEAAARFGIAVELFEARNDAELRAGSFSRLRRRGAADRIAS